MTIDQDIERDGKSRPKVSLGAGEWVALGLFFLAQTFVLLGVGVQMWTRLAVLELELKHVSNTVVEIKAQVNADAVNARTQEGK